MGMTRELDGGLANVILLLSRTLGPFKFVLEVSATYVTIRRKKINQTFSVLSDPFVKSRSNMGTVRLLVCMCWKNCA